MADLFRRNSSNPILRPADVTPSRDDFEVAGLFNPGVFTYAGRVGLLIRVAERPHPETGWLTTPILDDSAEGGVRILRIRDDDPDLEFDDPRLFTYRGTTYLTTLSHLRLAWSEDGERFDVDAAPTLVGETDHETFGIEDCRVEQIGQTYHLTYSAVSAYGVGVGLRTTRDWRSFEHHGMIIPPHNKDCALLPERIGGRYYALHRPSGSGLGGHYIWIASSPDLLHWGGHRCLATTREHQWDAQRVGAGAAPIRTEAGWLAIYHGADFDSRYCLGTLLLDGDEPSRLRGRCDEPVMEPTADYEQTGFYSNVVFTNGHVIRDDRISIYYGASDEFICAAAGSIGELLDTVRPL